MQTFKVSVFQKLKESREKWKSKNKKIEKIRVHHLKEPLFNL